VTAITPPPPTAPAPAPTPPAVAIRGLTKAYGTVRAVDGLDLDVPRGGIFGLIGPNGAGKTTTMLTIVTLLVPDAGDVAVLGQDPRVDPVAVRRRVGYMPDFFGLYDGLTCREYLAFFASAYELTGPERRAQVDDLLELVELSHRADTDTAGLSRGMQQRLSLARALVHDPELLVLDEPASGLDPRARVELRGILLELTRLGHTILVSSHILAELEEICDRVGIIETGRVLAQGSSDELRRTVAAATSVSLRVLGGEDAQARAVEVATRAGAVQAPGRTGILRFEVAGGDEAAAALLAALVTAGVRVVDFREEAGGLERLFLTLTQGVRR
jgi:ABC-2 type transport system ATP-binding protein